MQIEIEMIHDFNNKLKETLIFLQCLSIYKQNSSCHRQKCMIAKKYQPSSLRKGINRFEKKKMFVKGDEIPQRNDVHSCMLT